MEEKNVKKPEELAEVQLEMIAGGKLSEELRSRIYCMFCKKYIAYRPELERDYSCPTCGVPLILK